MTITSGSTDNGGTGIVSRDYILWTRQDPITPAPLAYKRLKALRSNLQFSTVNQSLWGHIPTTQGLNVVAPYNELYNFVRNDVQPASFPMDRIYNAAWEKFHSAVKQEAAEVAVNLAERREALSMITARLVQIYRAARCLRQFDLRGAAREFGLGRRKSAWVSTQRWRNPRDWAKLWLEWHFGWSPLIGDIYSSAEILDGTYPWFDVKESSGWKLEYTSNILTGGYAKNQIDFAGMAYCKISSGVEVTNPTLFKLNQLGLVNPASVVWELIPFSFLADWFGTFGLWLQGVNPFVGLSLYHRQHVYFAKGIGTLDRVEQFGRYSLKFDYDVVAVKRALTIPGPTIALRNLRGLSLTRGLTAISLVLGIFAPK